VLILLAGALECVQGGLALEERDLNPFDQLAERAVGLAGAVIVGGHRLPARGVGSVDLLTDGLDRGLVVLKGVRKFHGACRPVGTASRPDYGHNIPPW